MLGPLGGSVTQAPRTSSTNKGVNRNMRFIFRTPLLSSGRMRRYALPFARALLYVGIESLAIGAIKIVVLRHLRLRLCLKLRLVLPFDVNRRRSRRDRCWRIVIRRVA